MAARVVWNDGEGLVHTDFNDQQAYGRKTLYDFLLWNFASADENPLIGSNPDDLWTPGSGAYGSTIRPLRGAGTLNRLTASSVRVYGGMFLELTDGPFDADDSISLLAAAVNTDFTGIAAASAGQNRRDLVQARIVLDNAPTESRDFKDAVTGALSTSAIVKRADLNVEFSIKTGTEGTPATILNPTNLGNPDAGWSVIGAILVDDTGVVSGDQHYWDFRRPWGSWHKRIAAYDSCSPNYTRDGLGVSDITADNNDAIATFDLTAAVPIQEGANDITPGWCGHRIREIVVVCDTANTPVGADFRLRRFPTLHTGPANVEYIATSGTPGNVGTRVSSSDADHAIVKNFADDAPLWLNGTPSGLWISTKWRESLHLVIEAPGSGSVIKSVHMHGWGGF